MADTLRTLSALQALLADNTAGNVSAQDVRDFLVSVFPTGDVLLATLTASASASLDFGTRNAPFQSGALFQSDYDTYRVEFVSLVPVTSATALLVRVGTGAGPTYDSAANYKWAANATNQAGSWGAPGSGADTSFRLADTFSNGATDGASGHFKLYGTSSSNRKVLTFQMGYFTSANNWNEVVGGGQYTATTVLTGLQVFFSTGNIASGSVRIYGVSK